MIHPRYWSLDILYQKITGSRKFSPEEGRIYLNFLEPRDRTVLDIGAYVGDTAKLFLRAGAKKVICIEPNQQSAKRINFFGTEVYPEKFNPIKHLGLDFDVMKCDCEGYEMELLPFLDKLKNKRILIESHNHWINEQFVTKGFQFLSEPDPMLGLCLMGRKEEISEQIPVRAFASPNKNGSYRK